MPEDPWEEFKKAFGLDDESRKRDAEADAQQFAATMWALMEAMLKAGFTSEQAFELTKMSMDHALKR